MIRPYNVAVLFGGFTSRTVEDASPYRFDVHCSHILCRAGAFSLYFFAFSLDIPTICVIILYIIIKRNEKVCPLPSRTAENVALAVSDRTRVCGVSLWSGCGERSVAAYGWHRYVPWEFTFPLRVGNFAFNSGGTASDFFASS